MPIGTSKSMACKEATLVNKRVLFGFIYQIKQSHWCHQLGPAEGELSSVGLTYIYYM